MARIRSVHPSLFTDEAWVSCSPLARILYIGLWTDADDQGLFEWKPLQLKMRLLPGDGVDAPSLLAELQENDLIKRYEVDGKAYGAIRNFRKFQRPKKPNAIHPITEIIADYVALDAPDEAVKDDKSETSSEPVPHQFPTSSEIPPQMEDGGWRIEEELEANASPDEGVESAPVAGLARVAFDEWNDMAKRAGLPTARDFTDDRRKKITARLKTVGIDGWRSVLATAEASTFCRGEGPRGWRLALDDLFAAKIWNKLRDGGYGEVRAASPIESISPERWALLVQLWRDGNPWAAELGPAPDQPGTRVPRQALLQAERKAA